MESPKIFYEYQSSNKFKIQLRIQNNNILSQKAKKNKNIHSNITFNNCYIIRYLRLWVSTFS